MSDDMKNSIQRFSEEIDALRRRIPTDRAPNSEETKNLDTLSAMFRDLTLSMEELQVAEEELRQQNDALEESRVHLEEERERYMELFQFAPDAYLVTTADGTIQQANRAAGQLLGVEPRFLIGKPLITFVDKSGWKAFRSTLLAMPATTRKDEWEVRMTPRGGQSFDAQITVQATDGLNGARSLLRWLIRDNTERKRHVENIRELNEQLEQRVRERTAQLEAETRLREQAYQQERAARAEAERANALKLQFLAMISHELRTPLTTIKGFASTLLADDVTFSGADQHEFLQLIEEESDRLTELVEQLMDLARLKAGTLRVNVETLPLQSIMRMAQARLETLGANHHLIFELPTEMPHLLADGQRAAQVLVNLVGNAAKFSPPGTDIRVRVSCSPAEAQFDVEDQGPGIPPEQRAVVFEAFRQLEPSSRGRRGAGLGLAISKELVEAQDGRIWIQNATHPGTVISFTLPLAR